MFKNYCDIIVSYFYYISLYTELSTLMLENSQLLLTTNHGTGVGYFLKILYSLLGGTLKKKMNFQGRDPPHPH